MRRNERWLLALAAVAAVAVAFLILGEDRNPDSGVDLGRSTPDGSAPPAPQGATPDAPPAPPRELATREPSQGAPRAAPARDGDGANLPPRGKGRVRVVVDTTDGKPISGAVVRWGPEGGQGINLDLPPGTRTEVEDTFAPSVPLTVTVLSDAYYPDPSSARVDAGGGTATFRMRPRIAARVRLRDLASNGPVRLNTHATLRPVGGAGQAVFIQGTWPDAEGRLPVLLAPGTYDVEVTVAGYRVGSKRIEVPATGEGADFDVDLVRDERVGWLEVAVAGATNAEEAKWTVLVRVEGNLWETRPARVPSSDRLRVDGVRAGAADVMVWSPKGEVGWAKGVPVSPASGGETSITLVLGLTVDRASVLRDARPEGPVTVTAVRAEPLGALPLMQFVPSGWWQHQEHDLGSGALGPYPFSRVEVTWKAGGESRVATVER